MPIAAHYGCALVGLTLDEQGIPATAEGRFAVAERIVSEAGAAGIAPGDIYIDCLAMAVSTDQTQGAEILRAIRMVKEKLGVRTVLGVSNISFGLPSRDLVNATFLSAAFAAGLDAAIVNPLSQPVKGAIDAWRVLSGQDVSAREFIGCHALDVPSVRRLFRLRPLRPPTPLLQPPPRRHPRSPQRAACSLRCFPACVRKPLQPHPSCSIHSMPWR